MYNNFRISPLLAIIKVLAREGVEKKKSLSKSTNKPVLSTKPQNLGFRKKFAVISVQITTTSRNTTCKIHWALIQGLHKKKLIIFY